MENNQTIQTINRMEFEENIIRLGTGELDPRIFPKDKWNQVLKNLTPQIQSLGYLGPLGLPELQEALKHRILLNPGDIYGFEKTNSLRLSFSYITPEEFALAAETLAEVVRHAV